MEKIKYIIIAMIATLPTAAALVAWTAERAENAALNAYVASLERALSDYEVIY